MNPEAQWLEREYTALYNDTLASLPAPCRRVFVAVREDEQSYAEVAKALDISVKMVAKYITQAHRVFRDALREYGIVPPREKAGKRVPPISRRPQREETPRAAVHHPRGGDTARALRLGAAVLVDDLRNLGDILRTR
jgi:hypothetical protein